MKEVICGVCGKVFTPRSRNGKYCSDECRRTAKLAQQKAWYNDRKEGNRDFARRRKERLLADKEARIRKSVELAIEMGLREPDEVIKAKRG